MPLLSRRAFVSGSMAMAGAGLIGVPARATPNGWPIGLQLFTVGDVLEKDFEGTLKVVAEIGYQQIECRHSTAGRSIKQIADLAKSLGLGWRSVLADVPSLQANAEGVFKEALDNGLEYIVCGAWARDPSRIKPLAPSDPLVKMLGADAPLANVVIHLTLDDFKWTADFLNETGEKARKAGLRLVYHNESFEFTARDGVVPYDLLLERTEPEAVFFELDCGNMAGAGSDPVTYLTRHPKRYRLMHVKDIARDQPVGGFRATELGNGRLDLKKIFAAAEQSSVTGYYVEQGPAFGPDGAKYERPSVESARISYEYLKKLRV